MESENTGAEQAPDSGYDEGFVIDVDTTDAVEMGPVDPGEYKLQVVKAEGKGGTDKNGDDWKGISLLFDIPDVLTAALLNHMIFIPRKGTNTTEKQYLGAISKFSKFKEAFELAPTQTFTPEDLVGREVWAVLSQKEDPEYGLQNKIQTWIVSH